VRQLNYQKLIIVGNATKDAELKTAQESDVVYTIFRVGVSDGKKASVFFPVTVFGKQAEVVAQYVTKGMEVLVEGRVEAREDGRMNVVADRVVFGARAGGKPGKSGYEHAQETAKQLAE
jgi:single-strand DNA-binding protein